MPSRRIPDAVREQIATRALRRCEYCRSPSDCSASSFSVEHVTPRSQHGTDEVGNLAWSCMGCNDHKYTAVDAVDPVTGAIADLFHPRHQAWEKHFCWTADFTRIVGLTPTGRATVSKLKLNRPALIKLRRVLYQVGEHP